MTKQEFIKLIQASAPKWVDNTRQKTINNVISYCYDVLCSDEELSSISTELANTKQELKEAKQENATLETYKSGFSRLYTENENYKKELEAYKGVVKAQAALIELR